MSLKIIGNSPYCNQLNTFLATREDFYEAIKFCEFRNYGLVDYDGRLVSRMLKESNLQVEVRFQKTKNPWSSVNGWCYYPNPVVYLNSRKEWPTIKRFTYTVVHELVHLIGIDHGSNTLKPDCPHEVIAKIAEKLI